MDADGGATWQALSKLWAASGNAPEVAAAGTMPAGFAAWATVGDAFTAAAQAYFAASQASPATSGPAAAAAASSSPHGTAADAAAAAFGNFLRDRFSALPSPLAGLVAPAAAPPAAFAEGPAFGTTREHQLRWQRMADGARRVDEAQRRLQRLWSDALREAAATFVQRLAPPRAAPVDAAAMRAALRELYDSWIDCAEDAYARAARSDEFCGALADSVNAGGVVRRELQGALEQWSKLLDLPTRSEIDTLARRLRAVEAALSRQSVGTSAAAAPAAPAPDSQDPTAGVRGASGYSVRDLVRQVGKMSLYRYRPIARTGAQSIAATPLLIVYALVNRPHMMDLQADRSLIRGLLDAGLDVYLIDWGYPDGADRFTTLADYIEDLLAGCVEQIVTTHRVEALNLLGVCQGGVLSLCYAAGHQSRVRNLVTMVTPADFHTPTDLLSRWVRGIDVAAWVGTGNVSGDALNLLFLSLMPFRLTQQKYVDLFADGADGLRLENFMRVEQWIFDSPDQAGAAFREFVTWFYQENRLAQGRLEIAGRPVDLGSLRLPVLNLIGKRDHLVPPAASAALQRLIGSTDYTAVEFDLGHIGMYISARAQRDVPATIAQWLAAR